MLVDTIVAVTLITSISTLTGAGISGCVAVLINRNQSRTEHTLANENRIHEQLRERRQIRRDAYVQFLNQASIVEHSLEKCWLLILRGDLAEVTETFEELSTALHNLEGLGNLVALEGPDAVAVASVMLQVTLTTENAKVFGFKEKQSDVKPLGLENAKIYMDLKNDRAAARNAMIRAAQETLDETSQTRLAPPQ